MKNKEQMFRFLTLHAMMKYQQARWLAEEFGLSMDDARKVTRAWRESQ